MTDFALKPGFSQTEPKSAGARRLAPKLPFVQVVLAMSLAVCLTVPDSEVRAKLFKMNLIVKNLHRTSL